MRTRQVIVKELPKGALFGDHFEMSEAELPALQDGEVLVRTILMSIDAANRAWMQGATYREAIEAGDAMHTGALCEVMESKSPRLAAGDIVFAESVWADYAVISARKAAKMPRVPQLSHLMSVFGIAGKTAFHGLVSVGRPVPGETVVVSAAAGSVGVYVGQIAKAMGCHVVGIAGGPEKCGWVVDELGFDACVDYRDPAWSKTLKGACPAGIDVYFDNVGGAVLETVLFRMNERGRIVCCGAVSQYDASTPNGPRNLPGMVVVKRLRMEGFIVMDFAKDDEKALRALQNWVASGAIKVPEDIVEGLENAPKALIGLLSGDNRGKRMVRVGADPS
ncbi:NADP-dependent oxidoreductase [Amylibacter sp. IMCC11727]|uniref:NADP-dependent oxidoreductase n=1 Tax=Amylibacter sp. IMCC11727 TaxID=3039851 RepID=UPI00244DC2CA|nr:NADP-dependent oxidoreductase [Amylibacter sp. IMCC11727]WGI23184.1 NADP-dependent oxidoreductase [Amylibacter sp. IMCC11727]